jgi:LysM repeat protein
MGRQNLKNWLLVTGATLLLASAACGNPAEREEAERERQKILRAADQMEILQAQSENREREFSKLKAEVAELQTALDEAKKELSHRKNEYEALKAALEKSETNRAEERKVLLNEIGKLVAGAKATKNSEPKPVKTEPKNDEPVAQEKGYHHTVESGESLWAIVQAYREQGVTVTVDEVRKANNLNKNNALKTGQTLFIPKK